MSFKIFFLASAEIALPKAVKPTDKPAASRQDLYSGKINKLI